LSNFDAAARIHQHPGGGIVDARHTDDQPATGWVWETLPFEETVPAALFSSCAHFFLQTTPRAWAGFVSWASLKP
jgi:hypothetical protein